jgi:hypothetical protein
MTTTALARGAAWALLALLPLAAGPAAYGQEGPGWLDGKPCSEQGAKRDSVVNVNGQDHTLHYVCQMDYRSNRLAWKQPGLRR